jgi:hypothetical protein
MTHMHTTHAHTHIRTKLLKCIISNLYEYNMRFLQKILHWYAGGILEQFDEISEFYPLYMI